MDRGAWWATVHGVAKESVGHAVPLVWPYGQLAPPAAWNYLEARVENGWGPCIAMEDRSGGLKREAQKYHLKE